MEPAVKPAALATRTGVIGILATQRSLDSDLYRHTSACYASGVEIVQSEGEGFVELVESGQYNTEHAFRTVKRVVGPMLERGVDQIVLGCTHYPFLKDVIQRVIGECDIKIIDPSPAIAARVEQLLVQRDLQCDGTIEATYDFISAATDEYVAKLREFAYQIG
jgi:glutamate racemase